VARPGAGWIRPRPGFLSVARRRLSRL